MGGREFFKDITGIDTGNSLLNESIFNYLVHGLPPGSFVTALLENNLYGAASAADNFNFENLGTVALVVSIHMPMTACGSHEAVSDWLKDVDGRRTAYAKWYQEQAVIRKLERFES